MQKLDAKHERDERNERMNQSIYYFDNNVTMYLYIHRKKYFAKLNGLSLTL